MNAMKHQLTITALLISALLLASCATVALTAQKARLPKGAVMHSVTDYDGNGNEVHYKARDGAERWRKYDERGNVVYSKDTALSNEIWIEYASDGKMKYRKSVTANPRVGFNQTAEAWYDEHENEIRSVTDGTERRTELEYDERGNVIHRKESWGMELWYEYDERGNRTRERCAAYDFFTDYDRHGNEAHIVHIFANSGGFEEYWIDYEYDESGNVLHAKNSKTREEQFCTYNAQGKDVYVKRVASDGAVTESWHDYDERGNIIHAKSSRGGEWWYEYDGAGNMTHRKGNDGDESWYEYSFYADGAVKRVSEYVRAR